jgi:hypothetical protein
MKIKEMDRSVLHFALNILLVSLPYFQKYFVTSVHWCYENGIRFFLELIVFEIFMYR